MAFGPVGNHVDLCLITLKHQSQALTTALRNVDHALADPMSHDAWLLGRAGDAVGRTLKALSLDKYERQMKHISPEQAATLELLGTNLRTAGHELWVDRIVPASGNRLFFEGSSAIQAVVSAVKL